MTDPYTTLGLAPDATESQRKQAFRKLAKDNHPDRNPNDKEAEARFVEINNANEAIEKGWRPGMPPPGAAPKQNPFGFGGMGGEFHFSTGDLGDIFAAFTQQRRQRNNDIEAQVALSLDDAFKGTEVTINLEGDEKRSITVKVPPGVDTGNRIRVPQAGENTVKSLAPGDLYLITVIQPHPVLRRQGPNLIVMHKIDLFDMLLGTKVKVTGIDGRSLDVAVPPNSKPDVQLRITGAGMPVLNGNGQRGDLFVLLDVQYPELDERQRNLLREVSQ